MADLKVGDTRCVELKNVDGVAFYESDEGCLYPGMRDFFIACRTPETIKAFVRKTRRENP